MILDINIHYISIRKMPPNSAANRSPTELLTPDVGKDLVSEYVIPHLSHHQFLHVRML